MTYNVKDMKAAQDNMQQRKNVLLHQFLPFRDQFVTRLEQFTQEAIEIGLQGVSPCKIEILKSDLLSATLELNNRPLIIAATDETYHLEADTAIAAKIFLYNQGVDDNLPIIEVVVRQSVDKNHQYYIRRFWSSGPDWLRGNTPINDSSSQEAADSVIQHFYRLTNIWADGKPTLGAILKGGNEKPALGYKVE